MHSSLAAVVLCVLAQTAAAQCPITASLAGNAQQLDSGITTFTIEAPAAGRSGGAFIKTAAAGTHDVPGATPGSQARPTPPAGGHDDHPPRSGTAMLLTAIALMSGIALRRYGSYTK